MVTVMMTGKGKGHGRTTKIDAHAEKAKRCSGCNVTQAETADAAMVGHHCE